MELTTCSEQTAQPLAAGAPPPAAGEDWQNAAGEVVGQVEWLWSRARIAFVVQDDVLAGLLRSEGWRVTTGPEPELEPLLDWLHAATETLHP